MAKSISFLNSIVKDALNGTVVSVQNKKQMQTVVTHILENAVGAVDAENVKTAVERAYAYKINDSDYNDPLNVSAVTLYTNPATNDKYILFIYNGAAFNRNGTINKEFLKYLDETFKTPTEIPESCIAINIKHIVTNSVYDIYDFHLYLKFIRFYAKNGALVFPH